MTDKAKRKHTPFNARKYWMTYSIISLLLLIPFRIVGEWWLTTIVFGVISATLFIALLRFIRRYHWKRPLVVLMLVCALLPIYQIVMMSKYTDGCEVSEISGITQVITCSTFCIAGTDYITLRGLPAIGIEGATSHVFIYPLC